MRIKRLAASLLLPLSILSLVGCGGKTSNVTPPVPGTPQISSLAPASALTGGAAFSLAIRGSNFTSSSQVLWNGSARPTTFGSSSSVSAQIPAADIAAAGSMSVTVADPSGTSSASTFSVATASNPTPAISAIFPVSATATGPALSLTVTGSGFVAASAVLWNGSPRPTTATSATSLTAQITAADIAAQGSAAVTVSNAAPGGGITGPLTFTIGPPPNPLPNLASIAPASTAAAGPAFALTIVGTNFISTSQVQWNGAARMSTVISSTSITAQITAADIATAGSAVVTVSSPAPGGGASGPLTFTITAAVNPVPALSALAPNSADAGAAAISLLVTGSNFTSSSQVLWNGSPRPSTFASATSLTAQITAADLASTSTATVTVSSPAPGGGTSSALTFSIHQPGNPVPSIASLSPTSVAVGSGSFVLTVTGANFIAGSQVLWNGAVRPSTYVSSNLLNAQIAAADVAVSATDAITVSNPAPAGGVSGSVSFVVSASGNPSPTLTSLTPGSAVVSTLPFQINLNGTNFTSASVVHVGSGYTNAVTASLVNSTLLQVTLPASVMSTAGIQTVYVVNSYPGGGTSNTLNFTIQPSGAQTFSVDTIHIGANDIVWDPVNQKLYVTTPGKTGANGNSIISIDPYTLALGSSIFAGSEPANLAISDDSSLLYVAVTGSDSIQRFKLPGLTTDINFTLGQSTYNNQPYQPIDLAVAPGSPHTLAVLRTPASYGSGTVAIYDDASLRPKIGTNSYYSYGNNKSAILWGSDATRLYVGSEPSFYLSAMTVGSDGVDANVNYQPSGYFGFGTGLHFDRGNGYIYDNSGHIVNPVTGQPVGVFNAFGSYVSGVMVPDSALGTAYFVGQNTSGFQTSYVLQTFDINHFTVTGSITLNNIVGTPTRLVRWGARGLALITQSGTDYLGQPVIGNIYLISGSFVNANSTAGVSQAFEAGTAAVKDTWSAPHPDLHPTGHPDPQ